MNGVSLIVRPAGCGWRLDFRHAHLEPLLFASRAASEAQASALAVGFAISGRDARVIVRDQLNRLVCVEEYPAVEQGFWTPLDRRVGEA